MILFYDPGLSLGWCYLGETVHYGETALGVPKRGDQDRTPWVDQLLSLRVHVARQVVQWGPSVVGFEQGFGRGIKSVVEQAGHVAVLMLAARLERPDVELRDVNCAVLRRWLIGTNVKNVPRMVAAARALVGRAGHVTPITEHMAVAIAGAYFLRERG